MPPVPHGLRLVDARRARGVAAYLRILRGPDALEGAPPMIRENCAGAVPAIPAWWGEAEREEFEERAAILEYDANMPRATAEEAALKMVLRRPVAPNSKDAP